MLYVKGSDEEMKEGIRLIRSGTAPHASQLQVFITRLDSGIHAIAYRILRERSADPTDKAVAVTERLRKKLIERQFPNYDDQRPFWPWVSAIVWMASRELLRRDYHRSKLLDEKQKCVLRTNPYIDPSATIAQGEIRQLVRDKLKLLPKKYRVAVKARDLRGWSRDRTARWCNVSVQTISNWRFQGLKLLRDSLGPNAASEIL